MDISQKKTQGEENSHNSNLEDYGHVESPQDSVIDRYEDPTPSTSSQNFCTEFAQSTCSINPHLTHLTSKHPNDLNRSPRRHNTSSADKKKETLFEAYVKKRNQGSTIDTYNRYYL